MPFAIVSHRPCTQDCSQTWHVDRVWLQPSSGQAGDQTAGSVPGIRAPSLQRERGSECPLFSLLLPPTTTVPPSPPLLLLLLQGHLLSSLLLPQEETHWVTAGRQGLLCVGAYEQTAPNLYDMLLQHSLTHSLRKYPLTHRLNKKRCTLLINTSMTPGEKKSIQISTLKQNGSSVRGHECPSSQMSRANSTSHNKTEMGEKKSHNYTRTTDAYMPSYILLTAKLVVSVINQTVTFNTT